MHSSSTPYIYITFILFLLSNNSLLAQKCKYEKNEVDAVTEFAIKRTAPQLLLRINNEPIYFKSQCIGDHKYLKLSYYNYGNFSFEEQREISFFTVDDEEIILYPRIVPTDTSKNDGYREVTSLLVYKLSKEQYEKLRVIPIKEFKYFIKTGFLEKEIGKNRQEIIMNLLNCVE